MNYLVNHVRVNRVPVATIVVIDKEHIGVSVCNPKDHFSKKRGIQIALARAYENKECRCPNRRVPATNYNLDMQSLIMDGIGSARIRADRYFK